MYLLRGLAIGISAFYLISMLLGKSHTTADWAGGILFFTLGSISIGFALWGLLKSFAVLAVDKDGITRRDWNGSRTLRWQDIVRIDADWESDSDILLHDQSGRKLSIHRGFVRWADREELNALLETYLAPARERQSSRIGDADRVYRPQREVIGAGVIMLTVMTALLVFILSMPFKSGELWAFVLLTGFLGSLFLLFLWITLTACTQTLTVTEQDLTDKSIFRTLHIRFDSVEVLSSRIITGKHGTTEVTRIEGGGQKIVITPHMNDYSLLMDFIRQRVGETAKIAGETKARITTARQNKRDNVIGGICIALFFCLLSGPGYYQLNKGLTDQENYRLLDTQGRTTTGRVTGTDMRGSREYRIRFAYEEPDGTHHEGVDPVSYYYYQAARVGSPIRVTYVPGRGGIGCIAQSIGRRSIAGNIRSGQVFLVLGCIVPFLTVLALKTAKKPIEAESR